MCAWEDEAKIQRQMRQEKLSFSFELSIARAFSLFYYPPFFFSYRKYNLYITVLLYNWFFRQIYGQGYKNCGFIPVMNLVDWRMRFAIFNSDASIDYYRDGGELAFEIE